MDEMLADRRFLAYKDKISSDKTARLLRVESDTLRNLMTKGAHSDVSRQALHDMLVGRVCEKLDAICADRLRRVINATGVVMHTNLGRSILSEHAAAKVAEIATNYSNLEYSIQRGTRRPRLSYVEQLITDLTGAESALVVNNNAAAVFLALNTLANDRNVILSRGEIVEIGDGFRIGEIITTAGCHIIEVGATNRTVLADYQKAVTSETAALLKVHTSNYKIMGYSESVETAGLSVLAQECGIPMIEDMGSGILTEFNGERTPFNGERTPRAAIKEGADIVTFSGDKLLGGPQAGIIAGKKNLIEQLRKNQIMRCLRIDKLCLAALEVTLEGYIRGEEPPTVSYIKSAASEVQAKAETLQSALVAAAGGLFTFRIGSHSAQYGGGAMPLAEIESYGIYVTGINSSYTANKIEAALRTFDPPIITTIQDNCVVLDMLTVCPDDFGDIIQAFLLLGQK